MELTISNLKKFVFICAFVTFAMPNNSLLNSPFVTMAPNEDLSVFTMFFLALVFISFNFGYCILYAVNALQPLKRRIQFRHPVNIGTDFWTVIVIWNNILQIGLPSIQQTVNSYASGTARLILNCVCLCDKIKCDFVSHFIEIQRRSRFTANIYIHRTCNGFITFSAFSTLLAHAVFFPKHFISFAIFFSSSFCCCSRRDEFNEANWYCY